MTTVVSGGASAFGSGSAPSSGSSSSGSSSSGSTGSTSFGSPPPAAPPTSSGAAFLSLVPTSGWADVYLGGRRLGRTPLRRELPAGRHRLRILPYGQEPASDLEVEIEADIDQRLTIDLPPPPPGAE